MPINIAGEAFEVVESYSLHNCKINVLESVAGVKLYSVKHRYASINSYHNSAELAEKEAFNLYQFHDGITSNAAEKHMNS